MPTYNWPFVMDASGEGFEEFIATAIIQRHSDARQTNPAQGDNGIDIIRETPEGIEVWQVKRFTVRPRGGQWTQIRHSWERFQERIVEPGEQTVLAYHLLTPWTPTEPALDQYRELTASASFRTDWLGIAYVNALADEFPWTFRRFMHGLPDDDGDTGRAVPEPASTHAAQVELTGADNTAALSGIVSENYRIESGERTLLDPSAFPIPPAGDAAVFYRFRSLGEGRWTYEAVVPRSPGAMEAEPISVSFTFLDPADLEEGGQAREWLEWGVPFEDVRASTTQHGGPFGNVTSEESILSLADVPNGHLPGFMIEVSDPDDVHRFDLALRTIAVTRGAHTGWLRFVLETLQGTLRFELRLKPNDVEMSGNVGDVLGRPPRLVLAETETVLSIASDDTLTFKSLENPFKLGISGLEVYNAMATVIQPVARGLIALQAQTTQSLRMPDPTEITVRQIRYFDRLVSIYSGTPEVWSWDEISATMPDDETQLAEMKHTIRELIEGRGLLTYIEQPTIELGSTSYDIERSLVTVREGYAPQPALDVEALQPGEVVVLPAADGKATTSALAEWSPGDAPITGIRRASAEPDERDPLEE
jgi:hypothetical protein